MKADWRHNELGNTVTSLRTGINLDFEMKRRTGGRKPIPMPVNHDYGD